VKHTSDKFTFDVGVDVVNGPVVSTSGSVAVGYGVTAGFSLKVDTKLDETGSSPELKDYNLAASYTKSDVTCVLASKDKLKDLSLSVYNDLSKETQIGAQVNISKGALKSMHFGALYQIDQNTKLQTKIDDKGIVSANYILAIQPGVKGIASVQIDSLNFAGDAHKFGLSLILG